MSSPNAPSLASLPVEILIDNVLPYLPLSSIFNLSSTSKFFYLITSDETFWKRKLLEDYNFAGNDTARTTGWRFIYSRMARPKVYVWGESSSRRLGMHPRDLPHTAVGEGVPYPIQLRLPKNVKIVNLVAGGMSFHALDSKGDLYVWGTLNGTSFALHGDGFAQPCKIADIPLKLRLPYAIRSISCSRLHSAGLTTSSRVAIFTSWGRPFLLSSPLLSDTSAATTPAQVECGWDYTAILTKSGDVYVCWPRSGRMSHKVYLKNRILDDNEGAPARAIAKEGEIPCYPWTLECNKGMQSNDDQPGVPDGEAAQDLIKLPDVPTYDLPDLGPPLDGHEEGPLKLVKLAGLDGQLIGLTNHGHVLRFGAGGGLENEESVQRGRWEYLPYFSDVNKVKEDSIWTEEDKGLKPPESMRIGHISGNFKTFTVYSTGPESIVLMCNIDNPNTGDAQPLAARGNESQRLRPTIIPALQSPHNRIISVVLGDYHYGALTSDGKLLTWGSFSKGALGLGDPVKLEEGQPGGFRTRQERLSVMDVMHRGYMPHTPPEVTVPTEVRFDWPEKEADERKSKGKQEEREIKKRERYCFAATAAGWHMGALVIDLDPEEESVKEAEDEHASPPMPGAFPPTQGHHQPPTARRGQYESPPFIPFRVGFPGRGFGSGLGRGGPPRG